MSQGRSTATDGLDLLEKACDLIARGRYADVERAFADYEELQATPPSERMRPPRGQRPRCGAKCRDGHPCRAAAVWYAGEAAPRNGRCRMHGGTSTGPNTPEGRAAIAESNRRRAAAKRGGATDNDLDRRLDNSLQITRATY